MQTQEIEMYLKKNISLLSSITELQPDVALRDKFHRIFNLITINYNPLPIIRPSICDVGLDVKDVKVK